MKMIQLMRYKLILNVLFYIFSISVFGQYITVQDNLSPQQMIENYLIDQSCSNVSNINVVGHVFENGDLSYGIFNANNSTFPLQEGLTITTGRAKSATGPNTFILSEGPPSWPGDQDLEAAINEFNTVNATYFEFDFVPLTNRISFEYLFASEQYLLSPSPNQCNFSDGFAFLLKEINTNNFTNLAVVPGTTIPVKITTIRGTGTICPPANQAFFDAFNGEEHPTNYNGQTKILKAEAEVTPGVTYRMKLVIADQVNFRFDSAIFFNSGSFKSDINLGDNKTFANQNPACANEIITLNATQAGATTYQWFRNGVLISGESSGTLDVNEAGFYEVKATVGTCEISGAIDIEYELPLVLPPFDIEKCGYNGQSVFNLNEANTFWGLSQDYSITFFQTLAAAENNSNAIASTANFTSANANIWARISSTFGCISFSQVNLLVKEVNPQDYSFSFCDDDNQIDGFRTFSLNNDLAPSILNDYSNLHQIVFYRSINDVFANTNPLADTYTNSNTTEQLFAQISLNNECLGIVVINLEVLALIGSEFAKETVGICNTIQVFLSAPSGNGFSYLWSNGSTNQSITVNNPDIYTVTITNSIGCSNTKIFEVLSIEPPNVTDILSTSFQGNNNSIQIVTTNNSLYEYSIDGIIFQSSPLFTGLEAGSYTLTIRDIAGCFSINQEVIILDYPAYYTPNGDGINDFWHIKNLGSDDVIYIFDRFGQVITTLNHLGVGWDGNKNNRPLPSNDYWFILKTKDKVKIKGHFSLIR